jgi:RNA polymerase sigma-70 factor (ECF subfamily)
VAIALAARLNPLGALALRRRQSRSLTDARTDRDTALVAEFRAGDVAAFEHLVRHYQRPVFYLAMRYVKSEADAADLTQKTFLRAFNSLGRFRGDASFRTWLYRIAINLSLNHLRDRKRETVSEISDDAMSLDAVGAKNVIADERAERLRAAIEELPPKQKMVLELRIYDELPFKEVAALADCSENAAKVNFHHAIKRLRALLADRQETDE